MEDQVGTPDELVAVVHPAIGATSARPAVLVFGDSEDTCAAVRGAEPKGVHVLCLMPGKNVPEADAEEQMKKALKFLKEKYPKYVAGSPVHLLCEERYSQLGYKLMLREPGVFAHAYLPGVEPSQLSSTSVYALFSGGAKTLLLAQPLRADQAPLVAMADRGGLLLKDSGPFPAGMVSALDTLFSRDPRIAGSPPAKHASR